MVESLSGTIVLRGIECGGSLVESLSRTTVNYWLYEAECGGSLVESLSGTTVDDWIKRAERLLEYGFRSST